MALAFSLATPLALRVLHNVAPRRHCIAPRLRTFALPRRAPRMCSAPPSSVCAPPALMPAPPGVYEAAVTLGAKKAKQSVLTVALLGWAAGAYIALGGLLALTVGGASPALAATNPGLHRLLIGAIGLPAGLTLVVTTGAELFTGNTMLLTAAALRGRAAWRRVFANWALAYIFNFMGALSIVALALRARLMSPLAAKAAVALAAGKVAMPFGVAVLRGLACNWLVCLGILLAASTRDFMGKMAAVTVAVTTFVALGLDHSVANMFFIPLGWACGADVSVKSFLFGNLLPVTLGNVVGGALLVAGLYHAAFTARSNTQKITVGRATGRVPERAEKGGKFAVE